ncbi:hypothetical protein ACFLQY_05695, partial [Verrucomicrobiota bacterium]
GFFTLLALATLTAILYSRYWLTLLLTILCAISRPEGFIFAMAFMLCGTTGWVLNRKFKNSPGTTKQSKYFVIYAACGLLAFATTLFINYKLTGYFQFMSVMNKGYFNVFPLAGAIKHTLNDFFALLKGVFLGLPDAIRPNRQFFLLPSIGGLLAVTGILLYPREDKQTRLCECWILLSAGAVLLTVGMSQWQGISHDRYLAWLHPLWIIYLLIGVSELHSRLKIKYFLPMLVTVLILFQTASLLFVMSDSYTSALILEHKKAFAEKVANTIDSSETIASAAGSGIQFNMPEHKILNLSGITTPAFFEKDFDLRNLRIIDKLKHEPELRFDYWFLREQFKDNAPWVKPFLGAVKLKDNDSAILGSLTHVLYHADWSTLEGGEKPRLLSDRLTADTLVDTLDIGYHTDEISHDYECDLRLKNTRLPLTIMTAKLGNIKYSDVGRIVLGSESFTLKNISENKPVGVILRTTNAIEGKCYFDMQLTNIESMKLNENLVLRLFVDGNEVPAPSVTLNPEGFSEVFFDIPASYIKNDHPRITIVGDHVSFAYWFYQ